MDGISTKPKELTTILAGVINKYQDEKAVNDNLDELTFLADTAGIKARKRFIQKVIVPNAATYIGIGKANEIKEYIDIHDIDMVIFDDELSPSQLKNLEEIFKRTVYDRTYLILHIFAQRAKTAHAKTQVELAQYEYLLPRLVHLWTHLERQRGGIGLRGPGEREIETDRRVIRKIISKLKNDLLHIDKQMVTQRKNRKQMVSIALVGYTNAGKSTLMNQLSKADVFAEDKLFATLDTTTRKVVLGNLPFLVSDTVGFIRKLPHTLVESFKSTLDEVREADILLHIIDISHRNFQEQMDVVHDTLKEIDAGDKKVILVFNKIDNYKHVKKDEDDLTPRTSDNITLEELKNMWISKGERKSIFISAKKRTNMQELRDLLYEEVKEIHIKRYPYDNFLYSDSPVL